MTDQKEGKEHLGVVIVGHVDAGKSTTTGHLLFELGGMSDRDLTKLKAEAEALGKGSFLYAFWLDKGKDERERGVTIQCCSKEFFTEKYHYTVIDAPGHRDFVKNMISGASQADVAVLMVPANKGGFETSIQKGNHKKGEVQGQTRQHARLCNLLGIDQVIVGINKMDDSSVKYSEQRYKEIKEEVEKMLQKIGYKTKKIPFIPMSGFKGENLTKKGTEVMPWYKGFKVKIKKKEVTGFTLVDALNKVVKPPKRESNKPLRMPCSGVYKIKGVGDVITGRVEQGQVSPGANVRFEPTGATGKVFSVEMHHKSVEVAHTGDNVGLNVKNLDKTNMPHVGDVMFIVDDKSDPTPPKPCKEFTASVFVQDHPGKLKCAKDGQGGFTPSVHVRTGKAPCQLSKIHWKMGKKTGNQKIENPDFIEAGDTASVTMTPKSPFCVTTYADCKGLARVAAMDSNSLVMLGKIDNVVHKIDPGK